jgi:hypothetical protein
MHNAVVAEHEGKCISESLWKKFCTLLDLCVSSLRRGHANLLCIVPILTDGNPEGNPRWERILAVRRLIIFEYVYCHRRYYSYVLPCTCIVP